ncbi:MAG TPA: NAD-dependent malic enzyme [Sedimentisphaerales bacterium]|nr:NAD-dependent malic enzyme [Sedimentisphaerales bacterium]
MCDIKGSSWQQRYSASEIYTLRCKVLDKPGKLADVCHFLGEANINIGQITQIGVEDDYKIRDITIFFSGKDLIAKLYKLADKIRGFEIIKVTDEILEMHRRGSIEMVSRIPIKSLTDMRMLYTPGVASVCKEIEADAEKAWEYTGICDRVAIVTDGTAVLGLGDIGVMPSLPVMEGKAAIFAEFVKISGVPILVDSKDPDVIVNTVLRIAKSFGAIQLEDIAAPSCFEVEERLKKELNIPVFHDDQHGTATVLLAALINALKRTNKKAEDCSVIMLGAGAAGLAISRMLLTYGIKDIVIFDSKGALCLGRKDMNPYKNKLAEITNKAHFNGTLKDGFVGKDIFIGVSRPNTVSKDMIASMAKNSIVFPLSNPIGEIRVEDAREAGAAIAADGREINNALAYPGIFRGALDVRATDITLEMKLASSKMLASLAREGDLLPDVLDKQVHIKNARAVADAWKK